MKKAAGFLALSLVCLPQAAFCGSDADSIGKLAAGMSGKSKEDLVKSILVCARTLVDKRLGGEYGVKVAAQLMTSARNNSGDRGELAKLDSVCATTVKSASKGDITRDQQFEAAQNESTSCAAKRMLADFIKPQLTCHKIGAALSAAVGIGAGVKVDGAKCDSSDGRRWLELDLGAGIGGGLGLELDLNGGHLDRDRKGFSKNPLSTSSSGSVAGGMLIVGKGEGAYKDINKDDAPVAGLGVGFGGTVVAGGQVNIELVPLGTNENYLYDRLMKADSGTCDGPVASLAPVAPQGTTDAVASLEGDERRSKNGVTGSESASQGERAADDARQRAI